MLLGDIFALPELPEVEITDLAYDSRDVAAGTLFFCVPGFEHDGHSFAGDAKSRGAAALVVERQLDVDLPQVAVPSVRVAMGPAAARFFGEPTNRLKLIGVTGTNGKTTTAFLVRSLLGAAGVPCGLLGTVKSVVGGVEREAVRTTPESIDLQRDFAAMLAGGEQACAMEVSSHALELGRCEGSRFACSVFTNLTQDHLDFHGTMERYFEAKRKLFSSDIPAVIGIDDAYGRRLAEEFPHAKTFSLERSADYRAVNIEFNYEGSSFELVTDRGTYKLSSPLPGRFNVSNAVAAVAAVAEIGVDLAAVAQALGEAQPVPGRLEPVKEGQEFAVLVDYAHTPDSLENVLLTARELTGGRLICVFGCGGDRDRGKRPLMGGIASRLADIAILTSDNPRSEEPEAIVAEVAAGAEGPVETVVDREAAIERAVELAEAGDVVVVAGKGHEQGQEFSGGLKVPFDDVEVSRRALRKLTLGSGTQ